MNNILSKAQMSYNLKKNLNDLKNKIDRGVNNKKVKKVIENKLISLVQTNKLIHNKKVDKFLSHHLKSMSNEHKQSFLQKFKDEDENIECFGTNAPPEHCKNKKSTIKSLGSDSTNIEKFIKHVEDPLNYFASIYEVKKAEFKLECCCTM